MVLKELKQQILSKQFKLKFLIFRCENKFIPIQYLKEIANQLNLIIQYVESITELPTSNSLFNDLTTLHVLNIDKLDCKESFQDNCIILTKSISKEVESYYIDNVVEVDKLEEWQILDYAYTLGKGCKKDKLDILCKLCKFDIYRIDNELTKLYLFPEAQRDYILSSMLQEKAFDDLSLYSIFNLTDCIINRDISKLGFILKELDAMDVNNIGLITILKNNFKNIIDIQLSKNPTAESLKMNPKQFMALKSRVGKYSKSQLINIYELLLSMDLYLKTGQLEVTYFLDYLLLHIFNV